MRKRLALIAMCLGLSLLMCTVVSGQWVAYGYKASIKRMDNQITTTKYSADVYDQVANASILLDTYTTVADNLTGYLLVPVCNGCSENGSESSLSFGDSYLYLIRDADKTRAVWKFVPEIDAGLFNKEVAARPEDDALAGFPTSLKKLNQAWMGLDFVFEDMGLTASYGSYTLPYGFLGYASSDGVISSVGFGNAKIVTDTVATGLGLCDPLVTTSCSMITAITDGRIVGRVASQGCCGVPSIFDVCSMNQTEMAVVQGTWSIKINKTVSILANAQSEFEAIEEILISRLGGKSLVDAGAVK